MVEKSAWCGDQDFEAGKEHLLLRWHRHTAVDDAAAQWQVSPVGCGALRDLHRELARWCKDERSDRMASGAWRGRGHRLQQVQDRQNECGGLPRAGLGGAKEIAPLKDVRNRLGLNWGRFGVPLVSDGS